MHPCVHRLGGVGRAPASGEARRGRLGGRGLRERGDGSENESGGQTEGGDFLSIFWPPKSDSNVDVGSLRIWLRDMNWT